MKKIIVFILAVLYLGITTGAEVNIHYCMGKIADIKFDNNNDDACGKCGSKTAMPCCGHQYKLIKLSDAHQLVDNSVNFHAPLVQPQTFNEYHFACMHQIIENNNASTHAPPLSPPDICIKNCVFRI